MLDRASIKRFRCFEHLDLEPLTRLNVICGRNNAGKTSVLEALFLLGGGPNAQNAVKLYAFRGIGEAGLADLWAWLFHADSGTAEITATQSGVPVSLAITTKAAASIELQGNGTADLSGLALDSRFPPSLVFDYAVGKRHYKGATVMHGGRLDVDLSAEIGLPNVVFQGARHRNPTEDASRNSELEKAGREGSVLEALRVLEPRLERLAVLVTGNSHTVGGRLRGGSLLPINLMGEGMSRLLAVVLAILSSPKGLVLIDEIENGIHHSRLDALWKVIESASRAVEAQVVATTHSAEALAAASAALATAPADTFTLHRLDLADTGRTSVTTFGLSEVAEAVANEWELRGW
jgi:hypothetical protein